MDPWLSGLSAPRPAAHYRGEVQSVPATAEFGRAGNPSIGFLVGLAPDGRRVSGQTDATGAAVLAAGADIVGETVHVTDNGGTLTVTRIEHLSPEESQS